MKLFKRNHKKGFTLIELIVVIAILGIIAAIAIPRFMGFTDKAKRAADDQYGALIGNSIMVLLAAEDIELTAAGTDCLIDVAAVDGAISVFTNLEAGKIPADGSALELVDLQAAVTELVAAKPLKYYTATGMRITLDEDGVQGTAATPAGP